MTTIVTRTGKGAPLTWLEADANFTGLNDGKLEKSSNLSDLPNVTTARTNLGLGNVDNTSDINKPISTSMQTALNGKVSKTGPESITANSTSAALTITQTGSGNAFVVEDTASDTTPFVIDTNGKVLVGLQTPVDSTAKVEVGSANISINSYIANQYTYDLRFRKSRSATPGSFSTVSNNDAAGILNWFGDDGTSFINMARIVCYVDGIPGTNNMPGRLVFSTTPNGSSVPVERMRIDSAGNVGVGATARNTPLADNDLSFDLSARNNFASTPTAGGTLTFTNLAAGQSGSILLVNGANYAIAKAATVKTDASFLATISATGTYRLSYYCDGTNVYVTTSGALS